MQRLLQTFLSKQGHRISEVAVDLSTGSLSCTCPGFSARKVCKHVNFVWQNGGGEGEYAVPLPAEAVEKLRAASADPASWRTFLLENVTPVVI